MVPADGECTCGIIADRGDVASFFATDTAGSSGFSSMAFPGSFLVGRSGTVFARRPLRQRKNTKNAATDMEPAPAIVPTAIPAFAPVLSPWLATGVVLCGGVEEVEDDEVAIELDEEAFELDDPQLA